MTTTILPRARVGRSWAGTVSGEVVGLQHIPFSIAVPFTTEHVQMEVYGLTPREREVAALLLSGVTSDADIALSLSVSPHTASNQMKSIISKLGVSDRTQSVLRLLGRY